MIFKIFRIDFGRSLINSLSAMALCFILGFVVFASIDLKNYLGEIFKPLAWDADMLILPKGITPEIAWKNILDGKPDALIPELLYETLKSQIEGEQVKKLLPEPPLKVIAFIPYKNEKGDRALATIGDRSTYFQSSNQDEVFKSIPITEWGSVHSQFTPLESYQTAEWSDKVIMGIFIKGKPEPLNNLKTLIDRRTVAQAFYVGGAHPTDQNVKYQKLTSILNYLTNFIIGLVIVGLVLSLQKLTYNRRNLFLNFEEIQFGKILKVKFYILQTVFIIFLPILFGISVAFQLLPAIKDMV